MKNLGDIIRQYRVEKSLPLRKISAFIDVDQAILSKIERGQRNASREQVIRIAEYFKIDKNELLIAWLSDKIVSEVQDEDVALKALRLAEEKVKHNKIKK